MSNRRGLLLSLLLLFGSSFLVFSQDLPLSFSFSPRFWGPTLGVSYTGLDFVAEAETALELRVSAAFESVAYYRLPDGSAFDPQNPAAGVDIDQDFGVNRWDFLWMPGVRQGLVGPAGGGPFAELLDRSSRADLLSAYLYYRGRYDLNIDDPEEQELIYRSSLADRGGSLTHALVTGFELSTETEHPVTRQRNGTRVELSAEWAPGFTGNRAIGEAAYLQGTLGAEFFLPIYRLDPRETNGREWNRFSLYVAQFLSVDGIWGESIPFNALRSFGGYDLRTGLGGSVRGLEDGRYATPFKGVSNTELRATLPSIGLPGIVPGALVFFDAGFYSDPRQGSELSGAVASTGIGLFVHVLDIASLVFYTDFLLNEQRVDGTSWVPFDLGFGMHF